MLGSGLIPVVGALVSVACLYWICRSSFTNMRNRILHASLSACCARFVGPYHAGMRAFELVILALSPTILCGQATNFASEAKALIAHREVQKAEVILRKAIANGADTAEVHGILGDVLYRSDRYSEAIPELGRACQLAPDSAPYCLGLSSALIGDSRYTVAIDFLNAIQPRFDKLAIYHYNLGLAEVGLRRYSEGLKAFQKAVEWDPKMSLAQFFVGNCYADMGILDSAEAAYRKAIALSPGHATYCWALGKLLQRLGRNQEALVWLKKAYVLQPNDIPTEFTLARAEEAAGNLREAKDLLERIVRIRPNELAPHAVLARVYSNLNEKEKAERERNLYEQLSAKQRDVRWPDGIVR